MLPPDLVERDFTATAPDRLWMADITYVPTWTGFLYLAVVLDAFSRRVVGWAMANHLRADLVLAAFDMAIGLRRPDGVVHHSDRAAIRVTRRRRRFQGAQPRARLPRRARGAGMGPGQAGVDATLLEEEQPPLRDPGPSMAHRPRRGSALAPEFSGPAVVG